MTGKPLVSVVILNYNGRKYIEQNIMSVLRSSYSPLEIIFVDNASTDGSVEYVKRKFSGFFPLKVIVNDKNYGYARGNNIGIKYCSPSSRYIIFLNNDTEVDPAWIEELVSVMEADNEIGAAQSKVLLLSERKKIDSTGHFLDYLAYTYQRGEDEEDKGLYEKIDDITYPYGAAFIIRSSIIPEVSLREGLFDPNYFCYHEDADLGWRIRLRGYRVVYVPSSIVFHAKGGAGMRYEIHSSVTFHLTKNRLMSLIKNYDYTNLFKFLLPLLFLEFSRAIITLISMPYHAMATIKAILWVAKNFRKVFEKRLFVQHVIRKVHDDAVKQWMLKPDLLYNYRKFKRYVKIYNARAGRKK